MIDAPLSRVEYLGLLARVSEAELTRHMDTLGDTLGPLPARAWLRKPEVGMVMVRARIGGNGAQFNAGEATMTRCAVRLDDGTVGMGTVRGCSERHAELIAVADAMAQQPEHAAALAQHVFTPLAEAEHARRAQRSAELATSKVDFFTISRGDE